MFAFWIILVIILWGAWFENNLFIYLFLRFPLGSLNTFIGSFAIWFSYIQITSLFSYFHLDFPVGLLDTLYAFTASNFNVMN